MSCVCHAFASVQCCLVVTCCERADLLALVCDVLLYFYFKQERLACEASRLAVARKKLIFCHKLDIEVTCMYRTCFMLNTSMGYQLFIKTVMLKMKDLSCYILSDVVFIC